MSLDTIVYEGHENIPIINMPKTIWNVNITPNLTVPVSKPVNWFHRKMSELLLGWKWNKL